MTLRRVAASMVGLALVSGLVGCSSGDDECDNTPASPQLVIVVGVHQNAPAPQVHEVLKCDIRSTLNAGNTVAVVALDGDPAPFATIAVPQGAGNDLALRDAVTRAEGQVVAAVSGGAATSDGSDLIAALGVAADQAKSSGASGAQIAVLDSGLPDRGALDMTQPGMLGADATEVAQFMAAQGSLPDLTGLSVKLIGIGYTTAPQQPLSPGQRAAVTAILAHVLQQAGAAVSAVPAPRSGDGPATSFATRPVPVPAPEPPAFAPQTVVYDDTSALGFLPDSTQLREPEAAGQALGGLAAWLREDPQRSASIIGTCASAGTEEGRARLSQQRAETIRGKLIELGVDPGRLTAEGRGYTATPPDRLPDGTLDPAKAAQNRAVRITTAGH